MNRANQIDVSVVIGFRNWGQRRIRLAVQSIMQSLGTAAGEVIVSDYGSTDGKANQELASELGCKYVYTEDSGVWSRSRALNAGFGKAQGRILVSTDADMIFSPRSIERIVELARDEARAAFFLQCRDLPQGMDDEWVEEHPGAWGELERASRLRPRWGMGGLMAISREGFEEIRGFDERFHTYGGEDLDFAQRARRAGFKTVWVNHPAVRMYHMWHPPTSRLVDQTAEGREAVNANRDIVKGDQSFVRNYMSWKYRPEWVVPLVTVAICTHNRAHLIADTIRSVLAQTMQDFEILVIDDGGADSTERVVGELGDPRIRYIWQEHGGISAARNHAARESRGLYTAVLDDDDLMHPKRLEWHIACLEPGDAGNVGSFINFDNLTGEMALNVSKLPTLETAMEKGTAPGHSTWMIRTDVIRRFGYDESLTSGVDNNLMLRMLRSGLRFSHLGEPVTLRRLHDGQVTVLDTDRQLENAGSALRFIQAGLTKEALSKIASESKGKGEWPSIRSREELLSEARVYLPDHLVERDLVISGDDDIDLSEYQWDGLLTRVEIAEVNGYGSSFELTTIQHASYADMALARSLGLDFHAMIADEDTAPDATTQGLKFVVSSTSQYISAKGLEDAFILVLRESAGGKLPWRVQVCADGEVEAFLEDDSRWMIFGTRYWEATNESH